MAGNRNSMTAAVIADEPVYASVRDYITLLKPGVMSLVVFTGMAGMLLAPGHLHPFLQLITLLCIAMGSGGGAAINMWYDRDIDAGMKRTASRPIPAGRVPADDALALGLILSLASVGLLWLAVGTPAALWLAFAIFFYAVMYTMLLKRSTPQNIVIGGAAGAFPAVIGWLAVSQVPAAMPWLMFLIVFLWTPPHFWSLALYRAGDYAAVKVPMLPNVAGVTVTKRHILAYSFLLALAALAPLLAGAGWIYGAGALALNGYFLRLALLLQRSERPAEAMKLFGFSILYLFLLFGLLVLDHLASRFANPF
jgi:protoheme IX farnesyltransferase